MHDIMIDVECLSLHPDCHILSVAAIKFDRSTGEIKKEFYEVVNQDVNNGEIDAATLYWWMQQPQKARSAIWSAEVQEKSISLAKVLHRLSVFVYSPLEPVIWARGPMDYVWLESAYKREGMKPIWAHNQWADQRTICNAIGRDALVANPGTTHNALDDCRYQIECLVRAFSHIS